MLWFREASARPSDVSWGQGAVASEDARAPRGGLPGGQRYRMTDKFSAIRRRRPGKWGGVWIRRGRMVTWEEIVSFLLSGEVRGAIERLFTGV